MEKTGRWLTAKIPLYDGFTQCSGIAIPETFSTRSLASIFFAFLLEIRSFFLKIWNRYQADFDAFNYGKFYAIVNDIPNCDSDTKTCHCANKNWLSLSKTGNDLITSKNIELEIY